jgi:carbonic anhydrase
MVHSRRRFLAQLTALVGISWLPLGRTSWAATPSASAPAALLPTPDQALTQLLEGNQRYVHQQSQHPHQSAERISDLAQGQRPIAVVLGCADSRVTPAIVFDQGLGDLFAIRVAGHVVDDVVLGSIEYAIAELATPLLVVLGHERCGAVGATVSALKKAEAAADLSAGNKAAAKVAAKEAAMPGHLNSLIEAIAPAVKQVEGQPGDLVDNAVRKHVDLTVAQLMQNPLLRQAVSQGKLKIVGARYDLDQGRVAVIA